MCKSRAEGGRRCSAHTRVALRGAEAAYASEATLDNFDSLQKVRAEYASTIGGADDLAERIHGFAGPISAVESEDLKAALRRGAQIREHAKAAERTIRAETETASKDPVERIRGIYRQRSHWDNKVTVPANDLSDRTLGRLARDPDDQVRYHLAFYRGVLPPETRATLADDLNPKTREAAAARRVRKMKDGSTRDDSPPDAMFPDDPSTRPKEDQPKRRGIGYFLGLTK